jgi:phosphoglycolate phosphatase-like HAD superfamily hydrolase
VEARHYASPPLLRCIVFEHRDGRRSAYLSFYDWPVGGGFNQRGAANKFSFRGIRLTVDHWLLASFTSWFTHLWGMHRIHTLLFDFDDTLFLTTECQVRGWIEAVKTAIDGKTFSLSDIVPDVRKLIERKADLTPLMTNIFLDEQQEQEILGRLFNGLPSLNKLELLRRHRWRVREELTARNAIPIAQTIHDIQKLSSEYQLAIVSATSENLVRQVLERHGLSKLFAFIIGRDTPRQAWQSMENKTQQFLRVSNMTGVPLERMVFFGDSDADYNSAAQLGLHFVENCYNARRHGRKSLIKSLDPEVRPSLKGDPGELPIAVRAIEAKVKRLP